MSLVDPALPRDPLQASALLTEPKGVDECSYPGCHKQRQPPATGTGRPSSYCEDPKHNPVTAHRARAQLRTIANLEAKDLPAKLQERADVSTTGQAESLRSTVLARMALLQADLERYVTLLSDLSDPDVSAAQIRAQLAQASAQVAEAQQRESAAQALRLAAETRLAAVEQEAQAEREAAEAAIARLEEVEGTLLRVTVEQEQQIDQIKAERDAAIEQISGEAAREKEAIERRATEVVARAQSAKEAAQREARQALARLQEVEATARVQAEASERLLAEAKASLERERAEVDRLRQELAATVADARTRAEADRTEARAAVERERAEIDRLRKELAATQARADQLADQADTLRSQLMQARATEKERPTFPHRPQ